jgi:hypothetical protein
MIMIQPLNTIHGECGPKDIADKKGDLEQGVMKEMLRSFLVIELSTQQLLQGI